MKFFRQRTTSESRRFSLIAYAIGQKTVDPIDKVVKKLRQALDKSQHFVGNETIDKTDDNTTTIGRKRTDSQSVSNTDINNDINANINKYLENLKQNIIESKVNFDNCVPEVSGQPSDAIKSFPSDIIVELIVKLPVIGFENKKLIATIVCNALLLKVDDRLVSRDTRLHIQRA